MLPRRPVLRIASGTNGFAPVQSPLVNQGFPQPRTMEEMIGSHGNFQPLRQPQQPLQVAPQQAQPLIVTNGLTQNVSSNDIDYAVGWEEILPSDQPTTARFLYPSMYKVDARGLYNAWRVGFEALTQTNGQLEMRHGIVNGAITVNHTQVTVNTSGRNIVQQGLLEARRRYLDKWDEGYRTASEFGTTAVQGESGVMKAHKWMDTTPKGNFKKQTVIDWNRTPTVYVQAKLDGIRLVCRLLPTGEIQGRSKDNKIRYTSQHVYDELQPFMRYLPAGTELDGEIYSHNMTFSTLQSVANTGNKAGGVFHPRVREVVYYIFDLIDPTGTMVMEDRYALLINAYKRYLEDRGFTADQGDQSPNANQYFFPVSVTTAQSDEEIVDFHDQYVALGYEGIMVRRLALGATSGPQYDLSLYVRKRSYGLLKYKKFFDEEGLVIGVDSTTGKGTEEGLALLTVQDRSGNILPSVRSRGSFEQRRQWALHPETIIGQVVTIRFQERSEYGVPRFPVVIGIRKE